MSRKPAFAIVGLGKMGGSLALQALEKNFSVFGYTKGDVPKECIDAGLQAIGELQNMASQMSRPRIIFLYVPAGSVVDHILDELSKSLESGDIVCDGGNSYWGDSIRRAQHLAVKGIRLIDLGTSGGVTGARHGACFMAGGEKDAYDHVEPILKSLAVENGTVYTGTSGSGHFTKLVHNGIEFGMLQAIGEGMALLSKYHQPLDMSAILQCWAHGSVIRSWLIELMKEQYDRQGGLRDVPRHVEDTGEVNWLVADAMRMEVAIPVISQAVCQLIASRDMEHNGAKAIALMRHGFGGHPFGEDEYIRHERQKGRVGEIYRP